MNNQHDNDQSSSHSGDNSNLAKLHAHWQAKFSADLRNNLVEQSNSDSAPVLVATEADTDKALGYHYHDMDKSSGSKNFDQKIYMFPPAYNALRKELVENWPTLWALTSYRMAFMPEEFCAIMNDATSLRVIFDSGAVNWMCDKWLNELIRMRMKKSSGY